MGFEAPHAAVDLFSGAGGLALGLESSIHFQTKAAIDFWSPAVQTFRTNFPEAAVLEADARELTLEDIMPLLGGVSPNLVCGGPPCQGFSSAGPRRQSDPRNSLVGVFARLVAELRPACFMFENVEGFLTAANGQFVEDLLDPLIEAGYNIHLRKVNAANYGVPQLRKRVVAIGGLGRAPIFPEPSHRAIGGPGVTRVGKHLPLAPSLRDALAGLPPALERGRELLQGHFSRRTSDEVLQRVTALAPGQTMRELPSALQHPSYERRAFRRVRDGTPSASRGGAPAGLRRLRWDEPSKAITGAGLSELVHPEQDRLLTIRECARIQTFPDHFRFAGTAGEQALMIGNSVPPKLASVFGQALADSINASHGRVLPRRTGRLLSFHATVADGVSPALARVTKRVTERYGSPLGTTLRMAI